MADLAASIGRLAKQQNPEAYGEWDDAELGAQLLIQHQGQTHALFQSSNEMDPEGNAVVRPDRERGPNQAWSKAQTIGAPGLGDRYVPPTTNEIMASDNPFRALIESLASRVVGPGRPKSVAAADPYGLEAALAGKGHFPVFMGTTEEIGAALDMTHAARMQRAAEQGYGRPWMYHETEAANVPGLFREGFNINRVAARAQDEVMPNGIFLKPTEKQIHVAQEPAQLPLRHRAQNLMEFQTRDDLEQFLLRDPHYAEQHGALKENERRYTAEFDALDKIAWRSDAPEALAARDRLDVLIDEWKATNSEIAARARARATDLLRASGAEGIHVAHDPGSAGRTVDTTVIFNPSHVRYPDAAFDPRELANPNLLAGLLPPLAAGAAAGAQQRSADSDAK
jgi:hypothetical protein